MCLCDFCACFLYLSHCLCKSGFLGRQTFQLMTGWWCHPCGRSLFFCFVPMRSKQWCVIEKAGAKTPIFIFLYSALVSKVIVNIHSTAQWGLSMNLWEIWWMSVPCQRLFYVTHICLGDKIKNSSYLQKKSCQQCLLIGNLLCDTIYAVLPQSVVMLQSSCPTLCQMCFIGSVSGTLQVTGIN